jgi:presenilin-like A22 family membrane protease
MINITWKILGIISVVLLLVFWKKRSAVWGGLFSGAIVGLIVAIYFVIRGRGFDWLIIGKGAIVGTLLGFIAELLGKAADLVKRK